MLMDKDAKNVYCSHYFLKSIQLRQNEVLSILILFLI
ncbi:MAG: hypothetical protein FD181_2112 [Prolixibacteraceae bacterium]|nr:MAG: hypothetical protein FD181_2112 [Prolixibacteraceae bacterium]